MVSVGWMLALRSVISCPTWLIESCAPSHMAITVGLPFWSARLSAAAGFVPAQFPAQFPPSNVDLSI